MSRKKESIATEVRRETGFEVASLPTGRALSLQSEPGLCVLVCHFLRRRRRHICQQPETDGTYDIFVSLPAVHITLDSLNAQEFCGEVEESYPRIEKLRETLKE